MCVMEKMSSEMVPASRHASSNSHRFSIKINMLFQNVCEVQTFVSQNNSEKNKTTLEAFYHLVQGIAI